MALDPETLTSVLLQGLRAGDRAAMDALVTILYDDLRGLAHRQRQRWHGDYTLDTTALVHEAYIKLAQQKQLGSENRAHFLALASRAMRHILSNYAEGQAAQKRGGGRERVSLGDVQLPAVSPDGDDGGPWEAVAAMHEALGRLESVHARACRVVECRFFGGLTIEETALALDTSARTVKRDWSYAQAWLSRELGSTR